MKRSIVRGLWGNVDCDSKMRKDINAIKSNEYCSIKDFKVYVFGENNYNILLSEGFDCKLVSKNPVEYDMETQLYRHKLDIILKACRDYDEIVFLDWDCVPVRILPNDFWDVMREKAPFQANLFQYRTKKCFLWRNLETRKVCNGGFLYLRDIKIAEQFIKNYDELFDWVEKQRELRLKEGKELRFREKALIFDDEPAITKWVDDDMDGWKGIDYYWEHYEPDFCNLKKKSVYSSELLKSKNTCFLHWG
jgi:hypothetical protein